MILHGKDLIVSIDGNAAFAGKSCSLEVNAKSIAKTSPTSGEWEENVPGKKSWSLSTNQLVKKATSSEVDLTGKRSDFYFSNSKESGWEARGVCNDWNPIRRFDNVGINKGIYLLEILANENAYMRRTIIFNKNGVYDNVKIEEYLAGTKAIDGGYVSDNEIIAIMPIGEYVLNKDVCEVLSTTYHVALPCVQFGNSPVYGPKTYDTSPIIIVGGKSLSYGYTKLNSIENEVNFNLYGGNQTPAMDGIPGSIEMVGKMVSLYMTDDNGSHWAGQAEVVTFVVTGTKGNLMSGSFSFRGNSVLQTDKGVYDVTPEMPEKFVDRIFIDTNQSNPTQMITGDINGNAIQEILSHFHRYLCKYMDNGTMVMCQLDDENSTKFHNGTDATLDGSMGDVYVGCDMDFFYGIESLGNNKYILSLSKVYFQSGWDWTKNHLIAAFKAQATTSYNNNVAGEAGGSYYLRSIVAGRNSLEDTVSNLNTAKARMNNNFGFVGKEEYAIMILMYLMKYGNTNSQAMCGSGVNEAMPTGSTVNMGMQDSDSFNGSSITNLFGIENWWGGGIELMGDITYENGNIINEQGTPIVAVSGSGSPVIQYMFLKDMSLTILPQGEQPANTDYNSYFCDAVDFEDQEGQYAGTNIYRGKGGSADGGINWLKLGANMTSGTRLRFRGRSVEIITNPQTFINLTAADPSL